MSIQSRKAAARADAMARRKAAKAAADEARACGLLADYLAPHRGKVLAGYMAIRTEIDPLPIMTAWQGTVCVPVIARAGAALEFHRWTPKTRMIAGPFGAQIPQSAARQTPDIVIVPLLAFDSAGNRLGFGGGFYDRTLEDLRDRGSVLAVGFAFAAQQAADLPTEPTDQVLDAVVTETGVREFARAAK